MLQVDDTAEIVYLILVKQKMNSMTKNFNHRKIVVKLIKVVSHLQKKGSTPF